MKGRENLLLLTLSPTRSRPARGDNIFMGITPRWPVDFPEEIWYFSPHGAIV
jgi:hypothetical protein